MRNPDPKQVVRIGTTLYTLYRFADQSLFNVFLPARAWRRNCEDASSSPMKGPLKLLMKTPLHRPIDPSTHRPMDQSAWQHLWPLISAKVSWTAAICREARSSLWILSSSSDAKCVFGSMAKPFPSATHGNSYFKFSGLSRGKVDKLITPRHLQALERLLHSQHVFAHQFTSQGIQHFLWAWQRSLSPSNIFRPCRRAYERCMRRIYGTLKNKNSRSKCTCLVKAWLWHASWEMHSRTLRVYAVLIWAVSCTRSQTTQLKSSSTSKAFPKVLLCVPPNILSTLRRGHNTWYMVEVLCCSSLLKCVKSLLFTVALGSTNFMALLGNKHAQK